jgi:kynurenine formamidase
LSALFSFHTANLGSYGETHGGTPTSLLRRRETLGGGNEGEPMPFGKKILAGCITIAMLSAAGVVGASINAGRTTGSGPGRAVVSCPGGMSRLGHELSEASSVFPGDPAIHISDEYTVAVDFFKVEDIDTGAHAGTHLDVPAHFIEDGRTVDELAAEEFLWPAYKIDVRGMTLTDNLIEVADILDFERQNGQIRQGSLVILQTGAEQFFGLGGPGDAPGLDGDDNANNTDDLFDFINPGFSGEAVQWMFDNRSIDGVGSDAYGPDAATDTDFLATFTTLANDGVALVALANLDSVSVRGDVIIASTVALADGSGFSTDPIACHARTSSDGGSAAVSEN